MVDYTRQINESGSDQIINNSRVRAGTPSTNAQGVLWMQGTGVVTSLAGTNQTLTAAQLGGGIVVHAPTAAATDTLDTATNILNYMNTNSAGISVGDILQCLVINGSAANAITIAAGSGGSSDGNQPTITIPANVSKTLTIRITNTTTPAYVVYC